MLMRLIGKWLNAGVMEGGEVSYPELEWCKAVRHWSLVEQHAGLVRKLKGHYGYYGITGNARALERFHYAVRERWRHWLARRSNKAKKSWEWFYRLLERYPLPSPLVVHSALWSAANH